MSPKPVLFRRFRFFGIEIAIGIEIDFRFLYSFDSGFDFDDSNMPGCCFSNL